MENFYNFGITKVLKILIVIVLSSISLSDITAQSKESGAYKRDITGKNEVLNGSNFFTPGNSELLSEKVFSIFVDSFDVKWFGTDKGISRFNGVDWDTINTDNYLLNNNVKQLTYERSAYGHEIWIATDGGLSVAGFDVDGVTSATTYTTENSGLINDTITAVGVDVLHNRWIGTNSGLNIFGEGGWDTLLVYRDGNNAKHDLSQAKVSGIGNYTDSQPVFIATKGGGVLRYSYSELDGFTGASTMDNNWTKFESDNINSVKTIDTIQYYGTENGFYIHKGNACKINWVCYYVEDGLLSNNVRAVEVDDSGIIWIGTDQGLNIKDGKKWYSYETSDGLLNPVINDIKKDFNGNIWIATNGGIEYFSDIPGRQTGGFLPIQSRNLIASEVESTFSNLDWTIGDSEFRVVFIKEGNDGEISLEDSVTYTANTEFGNGDEINGWYCIYNGVGNSLIITALNPNTMYRVMACEYMGTPGKEVYYTASAVGNPANFMTMRSGINSLKMKEFSIYPNPFNSFIEIQNPESNNPYEISIYSMDGKLQKKASLMGTTNTINTYNINPGTYIIQISCGTNSYSFKTVKK